MPISFACPSCQQKFKVPDGASGKKTSCPKCRTSLSVPVQAPNGATTSTQRDNHVAVVTRPPPLPEIEVEIDESSDDDLPTPKRGLGKPIVFALIGLGAAVLFVCVGVFIGMKLNGSKANDGDAKVKDANENKQDKAVAVKLGFRESMLGLGPQEVRRLIGAPTKIDSWDGKNDQMWYYGGKSLTNYTGNGGGTITSGWVWFSDGLCIDAGDRSLKK
jgi:hypothetical protein